MARGKRRDSGATARKTGKCRTWSYCSRKIAATVGRRAALPECSGARGRIYLTGSLVSYISLAHRRKSWHKDVEL